MYGLIAPEEKSIIMMIEIRKRKRVERLLSRLQWEPFREHYWLVGNEKVGEMLGTRRCTCIVALFRSRDRRSLGILSSAPLFPSAAQDHRDEGRVMNLIRGGFRFFSRFDRMSWIIDRDTTSKQVNVLMVLW